MDTTRELHTHNFGNPLHGLWRLIREMSRIADTTTYDALLHGRSGPETWRPAADVTHVGDDLVIRCELVGVREEDVEVTHVGSRLVITGTCDDGTGHAVARHGSERCTGSFRREIDLTPGVVPEDVHAEIEDGLLEVTVTGATGASQDKFIPVVGAAAVPAPRQPVAEEGETVEAASETGEVPQGV